MSLNFVKHFPFSRYFFHILWYDGVIFPFTITFKQKIYVEDISGDVVKIYYDIVPLESIRDISKYIIVGKLKYFNNACSASIYDVLVSTKLSNELIQN